jgi:hypothetical protein
MACQIADALTDAGIPFQITRGGEFVLDMRPSGKGQMAFRQAVELGLITLHANR